MSTVLTWIFDVKDLLVAQGVGVYGTNIFIGNKAVIPPLGAPDTSRGRGPYLLLRSTGGSPSQKTHQDASVELVTGMVTAIAVDYEEAETLSYSAYLALGGADGIFNTTIAGHQYLRLITRQPPSPLGHDPVGRSEIVFNLEASKIPGDPSSFVDLSWVQI